MESKVSDLQQALYRAAKTNTARRFYSLYDKVHREDVLREAWATTARNHGAAGVEGKSIEDIEREGVPLFLEGLRRELVERTYRPTPVRRVWIPKANGKLRALGIPTVRDRVVQTAVRLVLEPIFEAGFEPYSYGFRPGKSALDAVGEVAAQLNFGCTKVVDADIKGCFDNIPKSRLMVEVAKRVTDGAVLRLVRMFLDAGVLDGETLVYPDAGTPQGSPLSPLLANVYLDQLDKGWRATGLAGQWQSRARIVRYADDFVILYERYPTLVRKALDHIVEGMGLTLSEEKTRMVDAEDGFDFLGFRFVRHYSKRKGRKVNTWFPSPKAVQRARDRICELTYPSRLAEKLPQEVKAEVEAVLRGWTGYFRNSQGSVQIGKVYSYAQERLARYWRRQHHLRRAGRYRDLYKNGLHLMGTLERPMRRTNYLWRA